MTKFWVKSTKYLINSCIDIAQLSAIITFAVLKGQFYEDGKD
jgi:hypothetical protein